jgi:hypothetical protein
MNWRYVAVSIAAVERLFKPIQAMIPSLFLSALQKLMLRYLVLEEVVELKVMMVVMAEAEAEAEASEVEMSAYSEVIMWLW